MYDNESIPDYLQGIYNVLVCAFPDGLREDEYWPVLAIFHETMSFRAMARVLSKLAHKLWIEVYNDASGYGIDPPPPAEEIEKVRLTLNNCGYDDLPDYRSAKSG